MTIAAIIVTTASLGDDTKSGVRVTMPGVVRHASANVIPPVLLGADAAPTWLTTPKPSTIGVVAFYLQPPKGLVDAFRTAVGPILDDKLLRT